MLSYARRRTIWRIEQKADNAKLTRRQVDDYCRRAERLALRDESVARAAAQRLLARAEQRASAQVEDEKREAEKPRREIEHIVEDESGETEHVNEMAVTNDLVLAHAVAYFVEEWRPPNARPVPGTDDEAIEILVLATLLYSRQDEVIAKLGLDPMEWTAGPSEHMLLGRGIEFALFANGTETVLEQFVPLIADAVEWVEAAETRERREAAAPAAPATVKNFGTHVLASELQRRIVADDEIAALYDESGSYRKAEELGRERYGEAAPSYSTIRRVVNKRKRVSR